MTNEQAQNIQKLKASLGYNDSMMSVSSVGTVGGAASGIIGRESLSKT